MTQKIFDVAIVGQGIAGTLMSYHLNTLGKKVLVIDNNHLHAASKVAAGIVNPITGKNYVKSWRVDEFIIEAKATYDALAEELGIATYKEMNILRTIDSIESENAWMAKTADPTISHFTIPTADVSEVVGMVRHSTSFAELTGTFQVCMEDIISTYRSQLITKGNYFQDDFEHSAVVFQDNGTYLYKGFSFNNLVFCEGYKGEVNPFFKQLRFATAKGEVLIVRIPGWKMTKMYKEKMFIVPLYDDVFWVGAGYEWDAINDLPSENGKKILQETLDKMLQVPYEILDHKAAIRPTVYDRRPIIMQHTKHKNMFILNGLGTKGASIAPFVTKQLARYMVDRNPQDLIL